jgi:hypothetical protein
MSTVFTDNFHRANSATLGIPYFNATIALAPILFTWQPSHVYAAFTSSILDPNGNLQLAISTAGDATSGSIQPTWNLTISGSTVDHNVTWENIGPPSRLQIIGNECYGTDTAVFGGAGGNEFLNLSVADDQFGQFTIGSHWNLASDFNTIALDLRADPATSNYYSMQVATNSPPDGVHSNVQILDFPSQTVIFNIPTLVTGPGDVWKMTVIGTTLTVYQNGISLGSVVSAAHARGKIQLSIVCNTDHNDVSVASFTAGPILSPASALLL